MCIRRTVRGATLAAGAPPLQGWGTATLVVCLFAPLLITLSGGCPGGATGLPWAEFELRFNVAGEPAPVPAEGQPVFHSAPLFERIAGKIGSHAPTLTAFDDGELLAAWYFYDGPGELDGAAIYSARRLPGRHDWEPPELCIDRAQSVGNPVLYSEGDRVWLFHAVVPGTGWSTARIELLESSDRGCTWSAPRAVAGPLGSNVRYPPVRLTDGTLLLPAYDDLTQRSLFFVSADGVDWTLRSAVFTAPPHQNLQPSVVALPDGRLLAVMRNGGRGWLWATASDDGGRTWTTPVDSGFPNPASPAALLRLASANLILVYNDSGSARRPLSVAISGDEGATWLTPRVLVDGDGAYAYPSAIQTPDGLIHVLYSHDREWIGHLVLSESWIAGGLAPAAGD